MFNNNNNMEDELEEGEVHSEEERSNDEFSVDYDILPRPVKGGGAEAGSSRTMGLNPLTQAASSSGKHPALLANHQEEDEDPLFDKSSSSSDSSDAEGGPSGRKCRRMPNTHFATFAPTDVGVAVIGESAMEAATEENDAFNSHASAFQKKRQPNTVWSSLLQEEEASDILGKVNVEEYDDNHVLVERGPETFSVKYSARPRPPASVRSDSSSLSDGGLTEGEYECLCGGSSRRGNDEDVMAEEIDVDDREAFVEQFGKRPVKRKYSNSKLRRQKNKRKNKLVNRMRRMNLLELGHYMAEKLQEPKHNLIVNAIEMLGKDPMIKLFLKTTKIERRGGLLVKNQGRRRTPGGVFFYLLRGDPRFPRNTVYRIFATESKEQVAGRKRACKEAREKKLNKLREKQKKYGPTISDDSTPASNLAIKASSEIMDEVGSDEDNESEPGDVDSDEFCGTHDGAPSTQSFAFDTKDAVYDDQDCLDIDCDASDLA